MNSRICALASRIITTLVVISAGNTLLAQQQTLRILTYNIHHGEGVDGKLDLARQAEVIKSCEPDFVALQEVDDQTERTDKVDQTAELAKLTGLHGRFVHQLDFEGGRYGQAILSRFEIPEPTLHWLPGTPDRERRMAGAVTIQFNHLELTFVTTHLHHNNETFRRDQSVRLNQLFATKPKSENSLVILTGDLNATPDSQPLKTLRDAWQLTTDDQSQFLTFPAAKPERQLDYILTHPKGRVTVRSVKVIDEPIASDHRPLLTEIVIP